MGRRFYVRVADRLLRQIDMEQCIGVGFLIQSKV